MKKTLLKEIKEMNKIAGTKITKEQEISFIKNRLNELSISLKEMDFTNQKAFDSYQKQHKLRPDTKVRIAGKTTTAAQATKVKGSSVFGNNPDNPKTHGMKKKSFFGNDTEDGEDKGNSVFDIPTDKGGAKTHGLKKKSFFGNDTEDGEDPADSLPKTSPKSKELKNLEQQKKVVDSQWGYAYDQYKQAKSNLENSKDLEDLEKWFSNTNRKFNQKSNALQKQIDKL
jgi:hypothetical protein